MLNVLLIDTIHNFFHLHQYFPNVVLRIGCKSQMFFLRSMIFIIFKISIGYLYNKKIKINYLTLKLIS